MAATTASASWHTASGLRAEPPRPHDDPHTGHHATHHATVADILGQHGNVLCLGHTTLHEAAGFMITCDRTAAVVVDEQGGVLGAITENDILRAYASGVLGYCRLDSWLHGSLARLPGPQLQALAVRTATPLMEAAAQMRAQASGDFASRHLVVFGEDGVVKGVLSALDLARALRGRVLQDEEEARRVASGTVFEVMKPKGVLLACTEGTPMAQAVERMLTARQNCILVHSTESPSVMGLLTTRDALRAFFEGIPLDVLVGHWLFCLGRELGPRMVVPGASFLEAATAMADKSVHHLVVVQPGTSDVLGVVSSSDLAQALGAPERVLAAASP